MGTRGVRGVTLNKRNWAINGEPKGTRKKGNNNNREECKVQGKLNNRWVCNEERPVAEPEGNK